MNRQKTQKPKAPIGSAERILDWLKNNRMPEASRRSAQEIDAAIGEERRAWDDSAADRARIETEVNRSGRGDK
jgi:hypothetical protein